MSGGTIPVGPAHHDLCSSLNHVAQAVCNSTVCGDEETDPGLTEPLARTDSIYRSGKGVNSIER